MLVKEAKSKSSCIKNRFYYDSARSAFLALLKFLQLKENEFILFPAYIGQSPVEGSGVFDPVRTIGVKYKFYRVNEDLSIDLDDIKLKSADLKVKAVFIIHYFGFPQKQTEETADFCRKNNIILIEDCAHSMLSTINGMAAGCAGSYSLYSIHKICASETGGILQVNNGSYLNNSKLNINTEDLTLFLNSDLSLIAEKRRLNYEYYLQKLGGENRSLYKIFYKELPENTVPLNFPILIQNADRYEIYKKLISMDVPCVSLWHTLIKEINKKEYPVSEKISAEILNLPVHQDITKDDIDYIINKLHSL